ncbi:hypothetical protein [Henriciella aquimarina]|uniref:hypothetical protein n=1 Tax=Henriciella aquimarina TaxID=545261 RepID=UPI000A04B262|nr:hypothetical protein [Henriciella aquimarina]
MSKPKNVIDKRMANALIPEAKAKGMAGFTGAVASKAMGGLWVGGNAWLSPEALRFEANALNRHFHSNPKALAFTIPLVEVTGVHWRKALFTNIIEIETRERIFSLRCYKAESFAEAIEAAVAAACGS